MHGRRWELDLHNRLEILSHSILQLIFNMQLSLDGTFARDGVFLWSPTVHTGHKGHVQCVATM